MIRVCLFFPYFFFLSLLTKTNRFEWNWPMQGGCGVQNIVRAVCFALGGPVLFCFLAVIARLFAVLFTIALCFCIVCWPVGIRRPFNFCGKTEVVCCIVIKTKTHRWVVDPRRCKHQTGKYNPVWTGPQRGIERWRKEGEQWVCCLKCRIWKTGRQWSAQCGRLWPIWKRQ